MQQIKGWLQSFLSLLIISGACIPACDSPPDWLQRVTWEHFMVPELPLVILFCQPSYVFANVISHMATKWCLSFCKHAPEYHLHVSQSPLKKCEQSIFSAVWQWECKIIGSRLFLFHNRGFFSCSNRAPRGRRRLSIAAKHRFCNQYLTTPSYKPHCPEHLKIPAPPLTLFFFLLQTGLMTSLSPPNGLHRSCLLRW